MKKSRFLGLLTAGLLMISGIVRAERVATTPLLEMSNHYEEIRLALLQDSKQGIHEHAKAIQEQVGKLLESQAAESAGVPSEQIADLEKVLLEIESAALNLSRASDLASGREDFFALTRPLARYRKLTGDESTIIAYCPMAQKAWIQPDEEIGNPYMGQRMPKCGEVVGK